MLQRPPKMSEYSVIHVEYVTPGGVLTRKFADGAATMRICLGHIYHPDDGLLIEMDDFYEPVPWENLEAKEDAIQSALSRMDIMAEQKADLVKHIKSTPHYE